MVQHECKHDKDIEKLKIEIAVAKSDIRTVKDEITGIKQELSKFKWWFISIMASSLATLIFMILNK